MYQQVIYMDISQIRQPSANLGQRSLIQGAAIQELNRGAGKKEQRGGNEV